MKSYALFVVLSLFFVAGSSAKIRNGYAIDIEGANASLRKLRSLLNDDKSLSIFQQLTIKNKINDLVGFICYYELTERLLGEFKNISPDLFAEIDTITDRRSRNPDVYVKFVPEKDMPPGVAGTTNVNHDEHDPDTYVSEYGTLTVSVRITTVKQSLHLLAHELGHVKYQVPNLRSYFQFYTTFYSNNHKFKSIGHNDNDPSGEHARVFSKRFRERYLSLLKLGLLKIESHMSLLQQIRNRIESL